MSRRAWRLLFSVLGTIFWISAGVQAQTVSLDSLDQLR